MFLTGKIEVFINKDGYLTGVIKSFKDRIVTGKSFISVYIDDKTLVEKLTKGVTYTLNVKSGYLNSLMVECDKPFNKIEVFIRECEIVSEFKPNKKEG